MGTYNRVVDRTEENAAGFHHSDKSAGFEKVQNIIADKVQNFADTLGEKTADLDAQSGMAQYGKQASEWLDQSADYIRQFDCAQATSAIRESVGRHPGRTLLIAGGVGLIIGAFLRRR